MKNIAAVAGGGRVIDFSETAFSAAVCTDVAYYPPHTHSFIEIQYVFDGGGIHYINNREYKVQRGDLLFLNYNDIHAHRPAAPMKICTIQIAPANKNSSDNSKSIEPENRLSLTLMKELNRSIRELIPHITYKGEEILRIETVFRELLAEYRNKLEGSDVVISSLLKILFTSMLRKSDSLNEKRIPLIVMNMVQYIEEHSNEKIDLSRIAEENFYNPYYLSRLFKKHIGESISEHLNKLRCINAAKLLCSSNDTVENILQSVGYNDKKQFYMLFKTYFGCTPSEYRSSPKP